MNLMSKRATTKSCKPTIIRDVMIASFSHPNFIAIVQWGFWEKMHWKPAAALWREDWTLKPVRRSVCRFGCAINGGPTKR